MLWFNGQAEEAVNLYTNLFENSKIHNVFRQPDGGDMFSFTEAFSVIVRCNDQAEVDKYWDALTADGGTPGRCGWLKDKFGLSWQIIPKQLNECLGNPDPVKSAAAMNAMMGMSKLIVSELEAAVK